MTVIRYFTLFITAFFTLSGVLAGPVGVAKRSVSQSLFDDFTRYAKYSSAAYQLLCPAPLGNTLVVQVGSILLFIRRFEGDETNYLGE